MSFHRHEQTSTTSTGDGESDYGSELDNDTWNDLLSQAESPSAPDIVIESIEEAVIPIDDGDVRTQSLRLARVREHLQKALTGLDEISSQIARQSASPRSSRGLEIEYDEDSRQRFTTVQNGKDTVERHSSPVPEQDPADARTPLQRFREPPKKPLSVTDIVSPAWCELQYWYSLTKYGRIKRTPAMKQGSKIHKEMESQVHTEVPVETTTREDGFGLRLWNIVQGLRTLRETGMTRELEVIGLVEGQVMIGVIDEVSYDSPDPALEDSILVAAEAAQDGGKKKNPPLPADQRTMTDYLSPSQDNGAWLGSLQEKPQPIYLVDVKTRASPTLPKLGSQMRPTQMQLMLYHRLLRALAANEVDADAVFSRYRLDATQPFSDVFTAQLASINLQRPSQHPDDEPGPVDPLDEVLAHNTLHTLWSHMMSEFARTIPPSSLSPLLTAEFRSASSGALLGRRGFAFDARGLDGYVADVMDWWMGRRGARGVDVEEAYKCRICAFAEGCAWRRERVEEAVRKARLRGGRRAESLI